MKRAGTILAALLVVLTASGCPATMEELRGDLRPGPPALAGKLLARLPAFSVERLQNGLTLVVHEDRFLPLCTARLELRAGATAVRTAQAGLPALTYSALWEAALQPEDGAGLEELGVELAVTMDQQGAAFTLVTQSATLPEALRRLARGLAAPPRADRLEAARERTRERAQQETSTPQGAAMGALRRLLYGADHPLGINVNGTPAVLARLSLAEVAEFQGRALDPSQAALIVGGRISAAEARELAVSAFAGFAAAPVPSGPERTDPTPPPQPPSAPGFYFLPWKGLPQPLLVGGRLLGALPIERVGPTAGALGLLTNFVNLRLRVNQGASYGADDRLLVERWGAHYALRVSVQPDAAPDVLRAVRDFLRKGRLYRSTASEEDPNEFMLMVLRDRLWSDRERSFTFTPAEGALLSRLRIGRAIGLVSRYEGLAATGAALGQLFQADRALDSDVEALRETELFSGAPAGIYDPDAYRFVLVGDPDQIRRQLPREKLLPL